MATGEARMPKAASLRSRSALPRDVDIPVRPWMAERLHEPGYGTPAG
jgi:hypothetical protein